jgi:hypothetical protein
MKYVNYFSINVCFNGLTEGRLAMKSPQANAICMKYNTFY